MSTIKMNSCPFFRQISIFSDDIEIGPFFQVYIKPINIKLLKPLNIHIKTFRIQKIHLFKKKINTTLLVSNPDNTSTR